MGSGGKSSLESVNEAGGVRKTFEGGSRMLSCSLSVSRGARAKAGVVPGAGEEIEGGETAGEGGEFNAAGFKRSTETV